MKRVSSLWSLGYLLATLLILAGLAACAGTRADGTTTPTEVSVAASSAAGTTTPATAAPVGQHSITVSGAGIVTVVPDTAEVSIGASVTDASVATALNDVDQRVTAVIQVIRDAGVASDNIQTIEFSVTVNHDYNSPAQPVTGYIVTHLVHFSVAPPEKVGEIITNAVDAGANQINGINFTTADPSVAKEQARDLAVKDALARAEQFAQSAGVTLGAPISINEGSPVIPVGIKTASAGGVAIETGSQQIEVDVVVTYEIK